ncbi:MAG: hemerythrin domain-containing protein [Pseudomonadota bacterium]
MAKNISGMMNEARRDMSERMERLAQVHDDQFADGFNDLIATLETSLRDEEAVMEALNYPALRSHREQHARALGALHHAQPQVEGGDIGLGREALQLLPKWLLLHRSTMDLAAANATRAPALRSRRHSGAGRANSLPDRRARYVKVQAKGQARV